jgi:N utilization substance protein B
MQVLYQLDQNPSLDLDSLRPFIAEELKFPELEALTESMARGVLEHRGAIDERLARCAENWSLARMAPVDRNVLRLAVYEMHYAPEPTPPKVAMDEAVEICKRFSTEKSARFVNGILDRIAREQAPAE